MRDVMIDLETLSTQYDALILSIGAVYFGPEGLGPHFYTPVSIRSGLMSKRKIDADTLVWWMKQSEEARKVFDEEKAQSMYDALDQLDTFLRQKGEVRVWGNGADFDIAILKSAYEWSPVPVPWKFYNVRCFRTIKSRYPKFAIERGQALPEHNALSDAIYQAKYAVALFDAHSLWEE